ncbi:MAG: ABC transporter permease, partial [Gemmatimonadota bacterium]|nr:ABC transporter permease [Gemmatimonadota bacterium]
MDREALQRPPVAPRLLLRLLPGESGAFVRLDLEEEFQVVVETRGRDAARRWYWRYAVRSVWDTVVEKARTRRHSRRGVVMGNSDWLMDTMHGIRLLRREPVVSSAMIGTMVLAIGAVSAVASLVYGVAIRPLPFPESERIVQLSRYDGRVPPQWRAVGLPDLRDWRERSRSMEEVAGWTTSGATVVQDGEASRILLAEVSEGFDRVLGISPAMGRFFEPGEFMPETGAVLVVSHDFWEGRLGADPQAVGKTIVLDEVGHRIVGILPKMALEYPVAGFDAWRPLAVGPNHWSLQVRGASWVNAVGRLGEGIGRVSAQSELSSLQSQLVREHPRSQDGQSAVLLEPLKDVVTTPARQALTLLGAAVTAILMIACLNLAILLLARASRRGVEFSVRSAIGASAGRMRRQLLAESLVVGVLGGLLGLLVAPFVLRAIVALYPGGLPRGEEVSVDWHILLGSAAVIVTTAIIAGLAPAFRGLGGAAHARLGKEDSKVGGRARGLLTGSQVAVCIPLLIASTLLLQTLARMTVVDTGFDGTGVSAFRIHPSSTRYPDAESLDQLYQSLTDRLRSLPGIEGASVA